MRAIAGYLPAFGAEGNTHPLGPPTHYQDEYVAAAGSKIVTAPNLPTGSARSLDRSIPFVVFGNLPDLDAATSCMNNRHRFRFYEMAEEWQKVESKVRVRV